MCHSSVLLTSVCADTPLLLAVTHHLDKVVELMIQKGVDCNQANVLQETPLARNMASVTQVRGTCTAPVPTPVHACIF